MAGVSTTHPDYDKRSVDWTICRDVISGERAMHERGEVYLPKLIDEETDAYKARVLRSNFFNGSWRTVSGMLGLLFRVPPKVETPTAIEPYLEDVTMSGRSLETFAKNAAYEVLTVGRVGVLIDHPQVENVSAITVAAATKMGLRPTLQLYQAEAITNWRFRTIRNAWTLAQVRLKECHRIAKNEWEEEEVTRYRVLDLDEARGDIYRVRVFEVIHGVDVQIGRDVYPLMNGQPLDFIPFKMFGAEGGDNDLDEPPMLDLFNANVALYQVNSDRRHGLHFTGLPTPVVSGWSPPRNDKGEVVGGKLYIGSANAWVFTDPNAKAAFLEFTGQGLDAVKDFAFEVKQEMAVLGARMLADETKQAETLGATIIKRTGEYSTLSSIAHSLSQALTWALGVFSQWAGQDGVVVYEINKNFMPTPMDAQSLTALVSGWMDGALSDAELFDALQRGEVITSEKTLEEHKAEVDMSSPPRPDPVVAPPAANAA